MGDRSGRRRQAPAVVRRFPRLARPVPAPIVDDEARSRFPELEEDFRFLEDCLVPGFQECDLAALAEQNRHRRQQLLLVAAGSFGALLGAVQAAFSSHWAPAVLVTLVAVLSAVFAQRVHHGQALSLYLDRRAKAERLRSMYFQFLVQVGPYGGTDRRQTLRRDIAALLTELRG